MKGNKFILFSLVLLCNFFLIFANNSAEYQKAQDQLKSRGEVYFKFYANSIEDVLKLVDVISIDNAIGNEIYAFANTETFNEFLKHGLYYEAVTPEHLLGPRPQMSDYSPQPDWTKYPTFAGYKNIMEEFQTTYPQFVKIDTIGESVQGRELIVAKVSANVHEEECEPEWFMMGAIHGQETTGIILSMRLIEYLCESYERDARAHRILDSIEMFILPVSNPDGTYKDNNDIFDAVRYNANGFDLNRNWPKHPQAGTSQNPEKETQVVMAWEKKHHIVMNLDWHGGVETAIYPYSSISRRTTDDDWWRHVTRIYADLAQENGPSGYFNDCNNGTCHGYSELGYVAIGTTKDWFYYYMHARGISNEVSSTKLLPESQLETWWNANIDAMLAYIQECLNGIRGTVVDEVTKVGKPAKIFIDNYDNASDSSFMYADADSTDPNDPLHGNYYRPILGGNYDVTYSCPGCDPKTVENVQVTTGQATIVNVELDCGSTFADPPQAIKKSDISILPFSSGIKINFRNVKGMRRAAIYNVSGKLIKTLVMTPGKKSIIWDGVSNNFGKVGSGCYILQVNAANKTFSQSFVLSN